MAIAIVPYGVEHEPLVRAFNQRMGERGTHWGFYDTASPGWLAPGQSPNAQRDYYLGVDETPAVRGAYCLKQQQFLIGGEVVQAASIQGPVSEGLIDQRFGTVALHLIRDMQQRQPRLFAWGASERLLGVLRRMRWTEFHTPLALRITKTSRFLRMNRFLRKNRKIGAALDVLAVTGVGTLAVSLAQFGQRVAAGGLLGSRVKVTEVDRFGPWADTVWDAARGRYDFVALRDRATMNALLPIDGWPEAAILRIDQDGVTIGWAAMRDTQLKNDGRFGDLRVGSIIDSLALPGHEHSVIGAAARHLQRRGVDVVVANYASPVWIEAFRRSGFLISPKRRILVASPPLAEQLGAGSSHGMHLTPLDGDGPLGL